MTATVNTLGTVLGLEFSLACSALADARATVRSKDTPAHRAAVRDVLTRIDATARHVPRRGRTAALTGNRPRDVRPTGPRPRPR